METKTIAFSEFYLKDISHGEIGDKLTSADFDELQSAYKKGEKYSVEKWLLKDIQIEIHEDFIWFILKQGKATPHSPEVFNNQLGEYEKNPREKHQIEPNKQTFLAVRKGDGLCFISNLNKRDDYLEYISKLLSKKVGFSPVFKSIEEIEKTLKILDEVHLRVNDGLFVESNDVTKVSQALFRNVGIIPDEIQITAKFLRRNIPAKFSHFFNRFIGNTAISFFSCTCKDEKNMEYVLNSKEFIKRISITVDQDGDGFNNITSVINQFSIEFKKCCGNY